MGLSHGPGAAPSGTPATGTTLSTLLQSFPWLRLQGSWTLRLVLLSPQSTQSQNLSLRLLYRVASIGHPTYLLPWWLPVAWPSWPVLWFRFVKEVWIPQFPPTDLLHQLLHWVLHHPRIDQWISYMIQL
jgi:hypothetical protein